MKRWLIATVVLSALAHSASAHFIWIAPEAKNTARVVFAEDTDPDTAVPITKIAQTKIYQRGNETKPLAMTKRKNTYHIQARGNRTTTLGGICMYGVLKKGDLDPFLLAYYPKAVLGSPSAEVAEQASRRFAKLPLDIVVTLQKGKCLGKVLWHGKPARGAQVIIHAPGQRRVKIESADYGKFAFAAPTENGLITIRARVVENKAGTYQGKKYKSAKHYATFTIPVSTKALAVAKNNKENPAATRLLKNARSARATWNKFPGFSANIVVNHDGKIIRGTVTASNSAQVDLTGFSPGELKSRVRRQLISLVAHRLSNASGRNTPCSFADNNKNHPLGRKINVLNDELHSSYRIRDRQIIEVNRNMGKTRFTITVTKNYTTPEKKFLPAAYVVNMWNNHTNQLISSTTHYNQWKRVGGYDLPAHVMIVTAKTTDAPTANTGGKAVPSTTLSALTITLSNHRLLSGKTE